VTAGAPIAEQTAAAARFYSDLTGRAENGVVSAGTLETLAFWLVTFAINV